MHLNMCHNHSKCPVLPTLELQDVSLPQTPSTKESSQWSKREKTRLKFWSHLQTSSWVCVALARTELYEWSVSGASPDKFSAISGCELPPRHSRTAEKIARREMLRWCPCQGASPRSGRPHEARARSIRPLLLMCRRLNNLRPRLRSEGCECLKCQDLCWSHCDGLIHCHTCNICIYIDIL